MKPEECGVCGAAVPFADTVHVMIHTHSDEGVLDYYVCQSCYAEDLRPRFPDADPSPEPEPEPPGP
jgi:hypothetical protein